jgi:hypothetical protein
VVRVDLVKEFARLSSIVQDLAIANPQLGQKAQAALQQLGSASKALVHMSQQFSESYLDLTALELQDNRRSVNRGYWEILPPGRLLEPQILELVRNRSVTLKRLYQASLDFTSITKFSAEELAFARDIGDEFKSHKRFWNRLKKVVVDDRPFRIGQQWEVKGAVSFFNLLIRHGYVTRCDAQLRRGEAAATGLDLNAVLAELKANPLRDIDRLQFTYQIDRRQHAFLTGGWFEAYSYYVFEDMLIRLAADFEIYSRVQYQATQAGRSVSRGDIDLLVSLEDQIFVVECKSGDFSDEEAGRCVQKTRFLKEICRDMGVKETLFFLVAPPIDSEQSAGVMDRLKAEDIELVEPQDIRSLLSKRLRPGT